MRNSSPNVHVQLIYFPDRPITTYPFELQDCYWVVYVYSEANDRFKEGHLELSIYHIISKCNEFIAIQTPCGTSRTVLITPNFQIVSVTGFEINEGELAIRGIDLLVESPSGIYKLRFDLWEV